ncbi:MAG: hypothetical protein ACUVT7_09305 [Thermoplasmata archaeon]
MKCQACGSENPEKHKFCWECGAVLVPVVPVGPADTAAPVQPKAPYQARINLVCLGGAVLGILSLFMPWALVHDSFLDDTTNIGAFDFDEEYDDRYSYPDNLGTTVILFLIGTVVAFVTPLGGILQLIGSVGFILTTFTYPMICDDEIIFWVGAAIATMSSALAVIGLAYPEGIGFEKDKRTALDRLLTIRLYR